MGRLAFRSTPRLLGHPPPAAARPERLPFPLPPPPHHPHCRYTPYHARKAQEWAQATALPMSVDGVPGLYVWDETTHTYVPAAPAADTQPLVAHDAPALTIFGALSASVSRIYPAVAWRAANLYELPNPSHPGLPSVYDGAQYILKIFYADGSTDAALIARGLIGEVRPLY